MAKTQSRSAVRVDLKLVQDPEAVIEVWSNIFVHWIQSFFLAGVVKGAVFMYIIYSPSLDDRGKGNDKQTRGRWSRMVSALRWWSIKRS